MKHPWEGGKKVYINVQGHMTKMAAMAINRKKPLKNLLLQNQKANDFENWCEASVTGALQRPMILKLGMKHLAMEL